MRDQALLLDLSHEAILVRDLDGRITFWNSGAEETYGWTKEEALGNIVHSFLKTVWPVSFDEHMAALTREGRWEGELIHTRKDGSTLTVLSRQVLKQAEADTPAAILEINIDITERKQAEDETKKYAAQLETSNRELQDFAFVASHDLQEPLRKIQAFGDQLKTDCRASLGVEGADYLDRMRNAAARMQDLIQALLNYSRVTTKASPFSRTDLAAAAREAIDNLETSLGETGGQVEIGELTTIDADQVQMVQLFQNLIGNALKFHGEEKPVVKIYGLTEKQPKGTHDGKYTIFVEDNGIGFDEKYLDRIFTPFQRLHGRGTYDGTGIGLAICRKIVDRHGGSYHRKEHTRERHNICREPSCETISRRNRMSDGTCKTITILMADDDPDDCLLVKRAFKTSKLCNDLRFVNDGEDLMDYLYRRGKYKEPDQAPRPGLILLDLNMPRKDGREALKEIRADATLREIPVVVLTTSKDEEDIHQELQPGR